MIVGIASDHGGYTIKEQITNFLTRKLHTVKDFGTYSITSCDYPDYAAPVCAAVIGSEARFGILFCGTGIGMSMTANKISGIRAAVVSDVFSARATRAHNDANVLCLGQRVIGAGLAQAIIEAFLKTSFEGGRHVARIEKMMLVNSRQSEDV